MNEENHPFKGIVEKIENDITKVRQYAPFTPRANIVRQPFDGGSPLDAITNERAEYKPKNEDAPRAGELSSQVFNNLTVKMTSEVQETVDNMITEIVNLRSHVAARIDAFKAEVDKENGELEVLAKKHKEKVNVMTEKVKKDVEEDTKKMIALSNRLRDFADTVNTANEKFFKE